MAAGYGESAWFFPVGWVYDESNIIMARDNARIHREVGLLHSAMITIVSTKGNQSFTKAMNDIHTDAGPREVQGPQEE